MERIGLALLYPAREWSVCAPGHHGYPRAFDLILEKALRGHCISLLRHGDVLLALRSPCQKPLGAGAGPVHPVPGSRTGPTFCIAMKPLPVRWSDPVRYLVLGRGKAMKRRSKKAGSKQARRDATRRRRRSGRSPQKSSRSRRNSAETSQQLEIARLNHDLKEALEQQTATSQVLSVISSSPTDIQPVLEIIGERAVRLCDANVSVVSMVDADLIRLASIYGLTAAAVEAVGRAFPMRRTDNTVTARAIRTRSVCHVADVLSNPEYLPKDAADAARVGGYHGCLGVPMIRDEQVVGAIFVARNRPGLFSDAQVQLLKTFADQAVIAIENTRLLDDLNKLNSQLEQRVIDQVGEIERMGRLRRFLPPQVADLIVASGAEKQLESHRREITALFCDLRGFTGFSESSDPEDVMVLLRDYHAAIGKIIIKYSGTLERYAGDGVMVVFNDPVPIENPAMQAVLMALEMRETIGALIEKWKRLGHDLGFGIGIAHGFATLGTIGFEGRFDYAAIGTVSNVASRLCDEAKPGQILISPRVLIAVEDAVTTELVGEFALKGIRRPMAAYNVLATMPLKNPN